MTVPWPPRATDEEREIRLFKDALMRRSMSAVGALLSPKVSRNCAAGQPRWKTPMPG